MKIAVTIGVYNEEKNIPVLIDRLLKQTRLPDQIIIVDDGSKDKTKEIVEGFAAEHPSVRYIYQENKGPAAARNNAWKNASSDVCIFTDGDCVPDTNWIEELIKPFEDASVGAAGGTYRTVNTHSTLSRFIGLEIAWKYSKVNGPVDAHGSYNLAVRRKILEEIGGYNEDYPVPSGEDWDMTYKISRKYKIIFVPTAIVGHYHPEKFWKYMRNQERRGFDRVKLYKDFPEKKDGDIYTPWYVKYQVLAGGAIIPSLLFFFPVFPFSFVIPLLVVLFMLITFLPPFPYYLSRDSSAALYGIAVQFFRNIAWFIGLVKGIAKFGFPA